MPVTELGPEAAEQLVALRRIARPLVMDRQLTQAQAAADLADPAVLSLGIRDSDPAGGLLAAAQLHVDAGQPAAAEVTQLLVAPTRQGRGLGTTLLRAAEDQLPARVCELRLQPPPLERKDLRHYARHGYRPTGSGSDLELVKIRRAGPTGSSSGRRRADAAHPRR